ANGFLDQPNLFIKKLIAQVNISCSNSMIETVDKKMKYEFLFPKSLVSFKNVIDTLQVAVSQYNTRPKTRPIGKRF
ncbi:hypothetical protein EYW00_19850, partial [Leptospira interrogans serovar Copenhageni]|nr:hypothetical protein [Leptospira interrogans serovar Copenhageni]